MLGAVDTVVEGVGVDDLDAVVDGVGVTLTGAPPESVAVGEAVTVVVAEGDGVVVTLSVGVSVMDGELLDEEPRVAVTVGDVVGEDVGDAAHTSMRTSFPPVSLT